MAGHIGSAEYVSILATVPFAGLHIYDITCTVPMLSPHMVNFRSLPDVPVTVR